MTNHTFTMTEDKAAPGEPKAREFFASVTMAGGIIKAVE